MMNVRTLMHLALAAVLTGGMVFAPVTVPAVEKLVTGKKPVQKEAAADESSQGADGCTKVKVTPVKTRQQYDDYYGTMITSDKSVLKGGDAAFRWGITNPKPLEMAYFGAYVKPNAKFTHFRATLYADSDIKADLPFMVRSGSYNGEVLKSETLAPGESKVVEVEIKGVKKLFIGTELRINHDKARRIIIGEPEFYSCK